jgi:hypothetical protein
MPKRSSKQGPEDLDEIAFRVLREAVEDDPSQEVRKKNPAAVELGRLGGLKGGRARATALNADERSAIARKAAHARWGKVKDD